MTQWVRWYECSEVRCRLCGASGLAVLYRVAGEFEIDLPITWYGGHRWCWHPDLLIIVTERRNELVPKGLCFIWDEILIP
jgi:hypothetical protein